jgi:DNA ligase-1
VADDGEILYVRPELTVEIAFSELQESPRYPAALALRFIRVMRYRTDKGPAEADSIGSVHAIFERQHHRVSGRAT